MLHGTVSKIRFLSLLKKTFLEVDWGTQVLPLCVIALLYCVLTKLRHDGLRPGYTGADLMLFVWQCPKLLKVAVLLSSLGIPEYLCSSMDFRYRFCGKHKNIILFKRSYVNYDVLCFKIVLKSKNFEKKKSSAVIMETCHGSMMFSFIAVPNFLFYQSLRCLFIVKVSLLSWEP